MADKVRFIRVNGRVVPIHGKGAGGPNKKSAPGKRNTLHVAVSKKKRSAGARIGSAAVLGLGGNILGGIGGSALGRLAGDKGMLIGGGLGAIYGTYRGIKAGARKHDYQLSIARSATALKKKKRNGTGA